MNGKRVRIDSILTDQKRAVCSFNGEGYILGLGNLAKIRGTEVWDGKRRDK